jgi:hypothetical protein
VPRKPLLRALALASALAGLALTAVPASAGGDYITTTGGSDISWPQCGEPMPPLDFRGFGIVGVNGGETYTMNPCFRAEWDWMKAGQAAPPSVYINVNWGVTSDGYNQCPAADEACGAYDYGYKAAEWAYTRANFATNGESLHASTWWLDVETMSNWSDKPGLNARVVAGAIDYLRTTGHKIGVYSTRMQWYEITGGYAPGPEIGNWVAGADSIDDFGLCASNFWAGATVWLIQYLNWDRDLDEDRSC